MAKNDKQWSSATPGLLIILLDQSGSMKESYEGTTRTKFASLAVNKVIDNKNIDIILKEMLQMSQEELLDYCDYKILHDSPEMVGPMFLLKNGKCLFVKDYYKKDLTHVEFVKYMINRYAKKKYPKSTFLAYMYTVSEQFTEELLRHGWLRANTGSEAVDKRFYCVLPGEYDEHPTNAQFDSLLKYFDLSNDYVFIYLGVQGFKFDLKNETSDDVLKQVKRYYSYGVINEDYDGDFDLDDLDLGDLSEFDYEDEEDKSNQEVDNKNYFAAVKK